MVLFGTRRVGSQLKRAWVHQEDYEILQPYIELLKKQKTDAQGIRSDEQM